MDRRSTTIAGFVNFPVKDPSYRNTNEGGMFVRLVVRDRLMGDTFVCCGGSNYYIHDETLLSEDKYPFPPEPEELTQESLADFEEREREWTTVRIPRIGLRGHSITPLDDLSEPVPAVLTVGSTGWSGWSDTRKEYFTCRYEDLTDEGKALYQLMVKLYPHCDVVLQTWLDT